MIAPFFAWKTTWNVTFDNSFGTRDEIYSARVCLELSANVTNQAWIQGHSSKRHLIKVLQNSNFNSWKHNVHRDAVKNKKIKNKKIKPAAVVLSAECFWFVETQQLHRAVAQLRSRKQRALWQIGETACELLIATWSAGIFELVLSSAFARVPCSSESCQIPCTPASLTVWHTGYNVIRCDPEQGVMTLVDGAGGADRYDGGSVMCNSWFELYL